MLRVILVTLSLISWAFSGQITTPPTQFPNYTKESKRGVSSCFISKTNQIVYSWADQIANPYFAIYDVSKQTFSNPATQIGEGVYSKLVFNGVYCCYNSETNQVIFSWEDGTRGSFAPWYAVYDVASQSLATLPTKIDSSYTLQVFNEVYCCYNALNNQVIFSWASYSDPPQPYYATLNADGSVSHATKLSTQTVYDNVYCCSTALGQVVFGWNNSSQTQALGAILDLSSMAISPLEIPTNSLRVSKNVFPCYDSFNHQVVFSWANILDSNTFQAWFVTYDLASSSFTSQQPLLISDAFYQTNESVDIYSCYNSIDKQIIFSWGENGIGNVYYRVYNPQHKMFASPAAPISNTYTNSINCYGVYPTYNYLTNQVFFSWRSNDIYSSGYNPWYAIYSAPLPASYIFKAINKFSPIKMQR